MSKSILFNNLKVLQKIVFIKKKEKNWMLMTYYCPTHGNSGRMETIEINREEISKTFSINQNLRKKFENLD